MREHLYQGKRKDNGEWVQGDLIHRQIWASSLCIIRVSDDGFDNYEEYEVGPDTVSEFTGQYDKNLRRVFEGYIVKWVANKTIHIDEVIFAAGQFKAGDFPLFMVTLCDMEVIGNKWDNPELLEGGAE